MKVEINIHYISTKMFCFSVCSETLATEPYPVLIVSVFIYESKYAVSNLLELLILLICLSLGIISLKVMFMIDQPLDLG